MQSAPLPSDETQRISAPRASEIIEHSPRKTFDDLARAASFLCQTPVSMIGFFDADGLRFEAVVGLAGATEAKREENFCASTILGDEILEIPDATLDPRFADSPFANGEAGFRFYAGVPLVLSNGQRIGALCVLDRKPRRLDEPTRETLRRLGRAVAHVAENTAALAQRDLLLTSLQASHRNLAEREARYRSLV